MKLLVVFATLVVTIAVAQRPSYAGNGYIGLPDLANRFRDDDLPESPTQNRFGSNRGAVSGTSSGRPQNNRNTNRQDQDQFVGNRFNSATFDVNAEIDDFGNPIRPTPRNTGPRRSGSVP